MSMSFALLAIVLLAAASWWFGRQRGLAFQVATQHSLGSVHSLPGYHGVWVALVALLPALAILAVWALVKDRLIATEVLNALPAGAVGSSPDEQRAFLSEVRGLVVGDYAAAFNPHAATAARLWVQAASRLGWMFGSAALLSGAMGAVYAWSRLTPGFRARTRVEKFMLGVLAAASIVAIVTTFGIVASLLFESFRFFQLVSPIDFLTGTHWSPQSTAHAGDDASSGFGAVPLFWGTLFIGAIIAMIVAAPLGLMTAVYLTQYANPAFRKVAKPVLEVLAGVPTVVYGFFAALTVAPLVRDLGISLGIASASSESALAAGLVMGVMIIPFISSMADDALTAVPGAMRDGSLAMGATPSETIRKVMIPAALPGIVAGMLLAVSRAIGETMIVVMAAGLAANLTANPFASVTTVTAQIVALLTGDQEFDSAKTLSAFALGLVLFLVTLLLNIFALGVVKKYREAYD